MVVFLCKKLSPKWKEKKPNYASAIFLSNSFLFFIEVLAILKISYWKETPIQVFSCGIYKIFKKIRRTSTNDCFFITVFFSGKGHYFCPRFYILRLPISFSQWKDNIIVHIVIISAVTFFGIEVKSFFLKLLSYSSSSLNKSTPSFCCFCLRKVKDINLREPVK